MGEKRYASQPQFTHSLTHTHTLAERDRERPTDTLINSLSTNSSFKRLISARRNQCNNMRFMVFSKQIHFILTFLLVFLGFSSFSSRRHRLLSLFLYPLLLLHFALGSPCSVRSYRSGFLIRMQTLCDCCWFQLHAFRIVFYRNGSFCCPTQYYRFDVLQFVSLSFRIVTVCKYVCVCLWKRK